MVALSRDSEKEKFARELGAREYVDAGREDIGEALQKFGGGGMSLIVATAPSADAIAPLLKGLGILGKLLILSSESALMKPILAPAGFKISHFLVAGEIPVDTGIMVLYDETHS